MKKVLIPFFSCLLVLTLLLGSFGSAKGEIGDDPVVTPVSGDTEFATEVVPIASLPGLAEYDQMLVPVGFPEGEAQFEGAGVLVTKLDDGKANACFTISGTQWGWGGEVGMWNGAKWVLLPTTITTTTDEAAATTACATITGSGNYTFIKYVVNPDLLPKTAYCAVAAIWPDPPLQTIANLNTSIAIEPYVFSAIIQPGNTVEFGDPVYYELISYSPDGSVWGTTSGTVAHGIFGSTYTDFIDLYLNWSTFGWATLYVEYPNCHVTLYYDKYTQFD